jgi:putative radical SAM enzyme (TIGR03279 family)
MKIIDVQPLSPAATLGLRPGDDILAIDGARVRDELDLAFHLAEERVVLRVKRTSGGEADLTYARGPFDADFGVTFEDPKVRLCGNDCIFCFVDQSPKGMREAVYVRDEDYRLSFLYGNFVTLTNLKEWEMRRVLTMRLSPLYVSVHSLDPDVRETLFGTPRARSILPRIDRLLEGGIELHTQIVLCPGHNDGEDLDRTIAGLAERAERGLRSLAVVPVGLTMHREGLPHLDPVTPATAREVYEIVTPWQRRLRARHGRAIVHLADEWYRLLDMETPPFDAYDGFPQLEDGIGLTRHFLHELSLDGPRIATELAAAGLARVTLVTGELFRPTLERAVLPLAATQPALTFRTLAIRNDFFGPQVTVAGLLAGRDVIAQLSALGDLGERVCLPPVSLNAEGRFMDDVTLDAVRDALGVDVVAGFGVGRVD